MMITLKNVTKEYDKENTGLTNVSLDVEKGEFIVGKSGSGKTTLMKLLQKELEPTSGQIIVNGQNYKELKRKELPKLRRQMGMVFQDFRLLKDRTIFENVAVNHPVLLLADEPTGNLDPVTAREIMELLSEINKKGTTVLVVTHNRELVNEMGKRVIQIEDGQIQQDEARGFYDI